MSYDSETTHGQKKRSVDCRERVVHFQASSFYVAMRIQAMAALNAREELKPWTFDTSSLSADECIVKVEACGICHSDLHMIDNDWRIAKYPLVPGHEIVGEVIETGSGVKHLKPGQRVGVGWQRSACLVCEDCMSGNENLCSENHGVITHGHGGFADHVVIDSRFCFAIPEGMKSIETAPLLCGGITVYSALIYAGMTHGKRIGVIGVGGLGHMAIQFASKLGNHVTAFTTSDDKAAEAARLGAQDAILTRGKKPRASKPFDIIISTIPYAQDWSQYVNMLGSDGTLTFVGVPAENLNIPVGLLLGKRRRIMASPIGGRAMIQKMLELSGDRGIEAIAQSFPMNRVNEALAAVRENRVRYRAVLTA